MGKFRGWGCRLTKHQTRAVYSEGVSGFVSPAHPEHSGTSNESDDRRVAKAFADAVVKGALQALPPSGTARDLGEAANEVHVQLVEAARCVGGGLDAHGTHRCPYLPRVRRRPSCDAASIVHHRARLL